MKTQEYDPEFRPRSLMRLPDGKLSLQITVTTSCSAKCHFCPYAETASWHAGNIMDMGLFRKIIDEAATIPAFYEVILTGLGETTLDPHLLERIKYIHSLMPDHEIWMFTNGAHLTPKLYEQLFDAGLSKLSISLNAVRAAQHEQVMGLKGCFERISKMARYAVDHQRPETRVFIHAVSDGTLFTREDTQTFFTLWGDWTCGGHGTVVGQGNWASPDRAAHEARMGFKPNEWCCRSTNYIYVLEDGRVSTCCFDPFGKQVFGDLKTQTLREIYASDKYANFRLAHCEDRADEYDICRTCTRA